MDLSGKTAVVTGGAQGIGRAVVERLHRAGASVASLDVDTTLGEAAVVDLNTHHTPATFLTCDVTQESQVQAAIDAATSTFSGTIDILVNNAGRNVYADATELSSQEWDEFFALDLKAAWFCSKYVLPGMRAANGGSIVNIASIHSWMTLAGMFPYAAAKSGLVGLTRSLALDCASHSIRVNAVCPGFIRTQTVDEWLATNENPEATEADVLKSQPLGRMGTPEEVANFVAFLCGDEATYITGAALAIDGGLGARFAT